VTVALFIVGVAALAILASYAWYAHDLAAARARLTGRSVTLETSFGRLEYAVVGEGEPLLVVHGASGGFDQALDMTGAVVDGGYRIIAPSRFGYLRSSIPPDATAAQQADAYVQLLDHLGIDRVDVVGISAGAWSSLQFAVRHPERCRALVLLVPADALPPGTSNHGGALVRAIVGSDILAWMALKLMPILPDKVTQMMLGTDATVVRAAEPSERARVENILQHLLPVSPRLAGMQLDIKTAVAPAPIPLERITCPVLAISAEDDGFGTASRARSLAGAVRDGRAIVFPTGGHALVGHYGDALRETESFFRANR